LETSRLPDSEVAYAPIIEDHHILPSGNAMITSFKSFGGFVQDASGVSRVSARSGLEDVPVLSVWFSKSGDGVANGAPRLLRRWIVIYA
jgi:hypothetical protein